MHKNEFTEKFALIYRNVYREQGTIFNLYKYTKIVWSLQHDDTSL